MFRKRQLSFVFAFLALSMLAGCASRFESFLDMVHTVEDTGIRFGSPTSTETLAGGRVRNTWIMDEDEQVPDEWVKKEIWVGRDRDGYPVTRTVIVFVPAHIVRHYCRLDIITGAGGGVLTKEWQGNTKSCERLLWTRRPEPSSNTQP